jgi:hypothetical protein
VRLSPVSLHEAAHITAAELVFNRPVHLATIQPSRSYQGLVRWEDTPAADEPLRRRMYVHGVIALCGPVAQSHFSGLPLRQVLKGPDLQEARAAATTIALSLNTWTAATRGRVFGRLLNEARQLVSEQWHVILTVASALEIGKTLNGAQVARLVHFANKKGSNK